MDAPREDNAQPGQERQPEAGPSTGPVRVRYAPSGAGISLVLDGSAEPTEDQAEATDGLLRVSAAVITLELPGPDGSTAVLAWDPAEVDWDSLVA